MGDLSMIPRKCTGLNFVLGLRPITYKLNTDALANGRRNGNTKTTTISRKEIESKQNKGTISYTGFIAQEVERLSIKLNYDF